MDAVEGGGREYGSLLPLGLSRRETRLAHGRDHAQVLKWDGLIFDLSIHRLGLLYKTREN